MWGEEAVGFDGATSWMTDKHLAKEIEKGLPTKTKDGRPARPSLE